MGSLLGTGALQTSAPAHKTRWWWNALSSPKNCCTS